MGNFDDSWWRIFYGFYDFGLRVMRFWMMRFGMMNLRMMTWIILFVMLRRRGFCFTKNLTKYVF